MANVLIWSSYSERNKIPEFKPKSKLASKLPEPFQKYRCTHLDGLHAPNVNLYVENLLIKYEEALLEAQIVDFELIVKRSMQLVERESYVRKALAAKFPWFLVDEYQDIALALHRMVKVLTRTTEMKLFAIGDINQCIYGFSGANPDYLNELCSMSEQYGKHIELVENFRSRRKILQAASIIAPNPIPLEPKRIDNEGVVKIYNSESYNSDVLLQILGVITARAGILPKDIMILHSRRKGCQEIANRIQRSELNISCFNSAQDLFDYRRPLLDWMGKLMSWSEVRGENAAIRFNDLCVHWQILLKTSGYSFDDAYSIEQRTLLFNTLYDSQSHINNAYSWLQFVSERLNLIQLLIFYRQSYPDEVVEYDKLAKALSTLGPLSGLSISEVQDHVHRKNQVYVGTLHSSKGQETTAVIIADAEELNVNNQSDKEKLDQNQRLFYVGITRAKNQVYIIHKGHCPLVNQLLEGLNHPTVI